MPTRFQSDPELARLTGWPAEIASSDLVGFVTPHRRRSELAAPAATRTGQLARACRPALCTLPWLGFVSERLADCPPAAISRIAAAVTPGTIEAASLLCDYGGDGPARGRGGEQ